jgi:hypothetical protein
MKIQQFAEQLTQESRPSPLMEALQAMRRFDLGTLRDLIRQSQMDGWPEWPQPVELGKAESGV